MVSPPDLSERPVNSRTYLQHKNTKQRVKIASAADHVHTSLSANWIWLLRHKQVRPGGALTLNGLQRQRPTEQPRKRWWAHGGQLHAA